nr:hypothetical protein DGKKSRWO_DGKKSRWO_CDS_0161 [uncultured phage]CAI9752340.1 hypothetical protein CVNMHQAP_CVNMHQAP_CDS_0163 [uncultured phage]
MGDIENTTSMEIVFGKRLDNKEIDVICEFIDSNVTDDYSAFCMGSAYKKKTSLFTHICKSDKEKYPSCFAIYARVIEETDDLVTIDRFQKWGAVHCGIITISRKDFNKYYKEVT